jgi:outer membrane protein assembly factor BamE (lipoprotein component of BamABCDE complex)
MKGRWWIVLGSAVFAAIGLIVGLSVFFGDPINKANFDKVQEGMTEADVVRLLGRPANNATHIQFQEATVDQAGTHVVKTRTVIQKNWQGSRTNIAVAFNENGTVDRNFAYFVETDTILGSIRRWLGFDPLPIAPPPAAAPPMASPYSVAAPASPPYPLPKELENLEEAAKKAYDDPQPE